MDEPLLDWSLPHKFKADVDNGSWHTDYPNRCICGRGAGNLMHQRKLRHIRRTEAELDAMIALIKRSRASANEGKG